MQSIHKIPYKKRHENIFYEWERKQNPGTSFNSESDMPFLVAADA